MKMGHTLLRSATTWFERNFIERGDSPPGNLVGSRFFQMFLTRKDL